MARKNYTDEFRRRSASHARSGVVVAGGQDLARLEAENATLHAEARKLTEERDILRQAAKYFAGETSW